MFLSNIIKKIILLFIGVIIFSGNIFGQNANPDFARSIGKIYVVVAVVVAVFVGIISFLIYLERKVRQLEQHIKNEK